MQLIVPFCHIAFKSVFIEYDVRPHIAEADRGIGISVRFFQMEIQTFSKEEVFVHALFKIFHGIEFRTVAGNIEKRFRFGGISRCIRRFHHHAIFAAHTRREFAVRNVRLISRGIINFHCFGLNASDLENFIFGQRRFFVHFMLGCRTLNGNNRFARIRNAHAHRFNKGISLILHGVRESIFPHFVQFDFSVYDFHFFPAAGSGNACGIFDSAFSEHREGRNGIFAAHFLRDIIGQSKSVELCFRFFFGERFCLCARGYGQGAACREQGKQYFLNLFIHFFSPYFYLR